jgi:hypothetical protein
MFHKVWSIDSLALTIEADQLHGPASIEKKTISVAARKFPSREGIRIEG